MARSRSGRAIETGAIRPGAETVARWAEKDPDADIFYVPGLSHAKSGGSGIVVVDADDEFACERVVETFGDTPGKVRTRRGRHFQYRDTGLDFRKLCSLKAFGINADVKHGNSIVVAPWSRHQKDRSFIYAWVNCDETVIRELRPFNGAALQRLIDKSRPEQVAGLLGQAGTQMSPALRDGSRKLGLNDRLVAIVWSCSSDSELLEQAFKINNEIGRSDPRGPGRPTRSWRWRVLSGATARPAKLKSGPVCRAAISTAEFWRNG